jgi:hypothetical protein
MAVRRTAKQVAASRANLEKARRSSASSPEHPMVSHNPLKTDRLRVSMYGQKIQRRTPRSFPNAKGKFRG